MKRVSLILAAVLVAMSVGGGVARAEGATVDATRYVEVSGDARTTVVPDVFYINITLNEADSKGRVSLEMQQKTLLSALKALGIDPETKLKVVSVSTSYYKRNASFAYIEYRLTVNTPNEVERVFESLYNASLSEVSFTGMEYSKRDEVNHKLMQEAMRNAKADATLIAEAIGQKVGKCIWVQDNTYYPADPVVFSYAAARGNSADTSSSMPVISFKDIAMSHTLRAKFQLE